MISEESRTGEALESTLYIRKLFPKFVSKDPEMLEQVEIVRFEGDADREPFAFIKFSPVIEESQQLPHYYPKVKWFKLCLSGNQLEFSCERISTNTSQPGLGLIQVSSRLLTMMNTWSRNHMKPGGYVPRNMTEKLIPKLEYLDCYNEMKDKYKSWVVRWEAQTDAQKFVFEDIAIASYLKCLWKHEPRKPRFVDVGCGNGLLVSILTDEGFEGYGMDVHRRPIWSSFDSKVDLRVSALDPSNHVFENVDWIVANHCDELTPWIPILAYRSKCKFWVLPCCFFDFSARYKRRTPEPRYKEYLDFIRSVGEKCGFVMEQDGLRIPSTRNVCFVGRKSADKVSCEEDIAEMIKDVDFKPRRAPSSGKRSRH